MKPIYILAGAVGVAALAVAARAKSDEADADEAAEALPSGRRAERLPGRAGTIYFGASPQRARALIAILLRRGSNASTYGGERGTGLYDAATVRTDRGWADVAATKAIAAATPKAHDILDQFWQALARGYYVKEIDTDQPAHERSREIRSVISEAINSDRAVPGIDRTGPIPIPARNARLLRHIQLAAEGMPPSVRAQWVPRIAAAVGPDGSGAGDAAPLAALLWEMALWHALPSGSLTE
jgi:hypothetical protein